MADQAELAFVKKLAENLAAQPVNFNDEFQPPLEEYLKKVPVLPIPVPPPPERKAEESGLTGAISITIKSVKPAKTYNLNVHPADTIGTIKSQFASVPGAPPLESIRLLLKGKALVDGKLLKEYDVKDGDTINLMVRSGTTWDGTIPGPAADAGLSASDAATPAITTTEPEAMPEQITLVPAQTGKSRQGHSRIPSVVLSPSPSLTPIRDERLIDIPLILDTSNIPPQPSTSGPDTPYHDRLSQPEFWERLYQFLATEFSTESDTATAWEDFFCASKGSLSVSEIAKIRDRVGVIGMAGH